MNLYGNKYNLSPRKQFYSSTFVGSKTSSRCRVTLIETEREKKMDLGTLYPFGALEQG